MAGTGGRASYVREGLGEKVAGNARTLSPIERDLNPKGEFTGKQSTSGDRYDHVLLRACN